MRLTPLLPLLLLVACATGPDRTTVLNSMIGLPEAEVVRRLGVPTRTYDAGGHRFMAYAEQRSQVIDGGPFLFGGGGYFGGGYGSGFGFGNTFPTEIIPRTCETTFDVASGVVQTWVVRGNACG